MRQKSDPRGTRAEKLVKAWRKTEYFLGMAGMVRRRGSNWKTPLGWPMPPAERSIE